MDYSTNAQVFPVKETKADKFRRLSLARTNNICYALRMIRNLSNTSNYDFSISDVESMFRLIDRELMLCKASFEIALKKNNKEV